jgi:hypothetical protein
MPCLMCSNANRLGEHQCVSLCCPGAQVALRVKLRTQYGIQVSFRTRAFTNAQSSCEENSQTYARIPDTEKK